MINHRLFLRPVRELTIVAKCFPALLLRSQISPTLLLLLPFASPTSPLSIDSRGCLQNPYPHLVRPSPLALSCRISIDDARLLSLSFSLSLVSSYKPSSNEKEAYNYLFKKGKALPPTPLASIVEIDPPSVRSILAADTESLGVLSQQSSSSSLSLISENPLTIIL